MPESDESFVLWVDRKRSQPGRLAGVIEQTRHSLRIAFGSTGELLRFLERGAFESRVGSGAPGLDSDVEEPRARGTRPG